MNDQALKDLLYKMADDLLILGHRNSEWTGMGPLLEEDIAFSSMAQDKIGQSYALFQMLYQLGEQPPDLVAFTRNAAQFHNSILTELPNGEYDFSLIRHFLFDTADALRWQMLTSTNYEPLSQLAKKIQGDVGRASLSGALNSLGRAMQEAGEHREAVELLRQSLELNDSKQPARNMFIGLTVSALGRALANAEKNVEARKYELTRSNIMSALASCSLIFCSHSSPGIRRLSVHQSR